MFLSACFERLLARLRFFFFFLVCVELGLNGLWEEVVLSRHEAAPSRFGALIHFSSLRNISDRALLRRAEQETLPRVSPLSARETEPRLPEGAEGERPARRARSDEDQRADSEADDVEGSFHDPTEPGAVDAGGFADDEDAIVDPRVAEARFGVVPVLTLQDFLL